MSRLDDLIAQYCPDGVEYLPLWSVTYWDKKFNAVDRNKQPKSINYPYLLAKDLFALEVEDGDVFLLSTGEQTGWTDVEHAGNNLCEGEVVTIPWGKSKPVVNCIKYYKGKFVTADNRIMTSRDTQKLDNKFLYYWVLSQGDLIDSFYRGSGIMHPHMAKVLELEIPVPPLPVQQEIVRILDDFSHVSFKLQSYLDKELKLREHQFLYIEERLIKSSSSQIVLLSDIAEMVTVGIANSATHAYSDTGVILFRNQNIKRNYLDDSDLIYITEDFEKKYEGKRLHENDILVTRTGYPGQACLVPKKYSNCQTFTTLIVRLKNPEQTIPSYVCRYINSSFGKQYVDSMKTGAAQQNFGAKALEKMPISLPSTYAQKQIVENLKDLEDGSLKLSLLLQKDILSNQKQYEYYRDKLFTFKEKKTLTE